MKKKLKQFIKTQNQKNVDFRQFSYQHLSDYGIDKAFVDYQMEMVKLFGNSTATITYIVDSSPVGTTNIIIDNDLNSSTSHIVQGDNNVSEK